MMTENAPTVKFVLSFDIRAGTQQVYYQFMIGQFIPALQGMGLQMTDAWHTVYGDYPSRINSFVGLDLKGLREMLNGPEWKELEARLKEYVDNYSWRIIPLRDGFQL